VLVAEEIQPQLQLKNASIVLKPSEAKISPLSATRDVIPEGRQIYQNMLIYNLNVTKAAEVALYAPLFNDLLYESEFESQMWMLFDVNKSLVATGMHTPTMSLRSWKRASTRCGCRCVTRSGKCSRRLQRRILLHPLSFPICSHWTFTIATINALSVVVNLLPPKFGR